MARAQLQVTYVTLLALWMPSLGLDGRVPSLWVLDHEIVHEKFNHSLNHAYEYWSAFTGPLGAEAAQPGICSKLFRRWILIARKLKNHPCADSQNQ